VSTLRVGLAQIAPRLGEVDENLARHQQLIADARAQDVGLLVFPELGLTGYLLSDLNAEVAMAPSDPRLAELATAAGEMSVVVGFVEESADRQLFIAAALLEEGGVRHVYRKCYLPNYGLFDERRFFGAGDQLRAVDSRLAVRLGISICEDFWHLPAPFLLALDGAQVLINVSSSPGRDVAATQDLGLGTASSWRTLLRAYAMLTTSFVVYVNRVGVEESITFWGGSEVIDPAGESVLRAPFHDEGLFVTEIDLAALRRERIALPLLRDERPELVLRQLERLVRARAGNEDEGGTGGA
jgi:predicted amidohydrolase